MSATVLSLSKTSIALSYEFPSATAGSSASTTPNVFLKAFPNAITLTQSEQIDKILADIPLLCTGTLALAVLVVYLCSSRLRSRPVALIIASALASFIAAIFDLRNAVHNFSSPSFSIIVSREMAYAAATGLRYLFFWKCTGLSLVRQEEIMDGEKSRSRKRPPPLEWSQWGTPGLVIKFIALAITFTILILQIVWRFGVILNLPQLLGIYTADAAMQILFAILLAVVLIYQTLATLLPPTQPKWETSFVALALCFQAGTGIGDLAVVRFSESDLGRFFLAIEFLIILVAFIVGVAAAVVPVPTSSAPETSQRKKHQARTSSFHAINLGSSILDIRRQSSERQPALDSRPPNGRRTTADRFSNWVSGKFGLNPPVIGDDERLWDRQRTALGDLESHPPASAGFSDAHSLGGPRLQEMSYINRDVPMRQLPYGQRKTDAENAASALPEFARQSALEMPVEDGSTSPSRRSSYAVDQTNFRHTMGTVTTAVSISDTVRTLPMGGDPTAESPTYGLEGIIRTLMGRNTMSSQATSHAPDRLTIPAPPSHLPDSPLRFPWSEVSSPTPPSAYTDATRPNSSRKTTGSQLSRRPSTARTANDAASARSEFTLSNFPTPPAALKSFIPDSSSNSEAGGPQDWRGSESFLPGLTQEQETYKLSEARPLSQPAAMQDSPTLNVKTPTIAIEDATFVLEPPRMPATRQHSFPSTTRGSDLSGIFDTSALKNKGLGPAEGNRIDVTSFIKGLSRPEGVPFSAASHGRKDSDRTIASVTSNAEGSVTVDPHSEAVVISEVKRGNSLKAKLVPSPLATNQFGADNQSNPPTTTRIGAPMPLRSRRPPSADAGQRAPGGIQALNVRSPDKRRPTPLDLQAR